MIKTVKLPPSLLTIAGHSFSNCSQLREVTFPSSLRSIEDNAFKGSALPMRDLKLPDSVEEIGRSAFAFCRLKGKLSTHITGVYAFSYCTRLKRLDLDNCKEIKHWCFEGCTGLKGRLKLLSSLLYIHDGAFLNCSKLTGPLIIPDWTFVHPEAFAGCTGMTNVDQAIEKHSTSFHSWKARGNVLMTLITFDEEYRRVVEKNGGTLRSALSNSFLADYSKDAQLIYKATAHVDGTDNLANGISRLIHSFLPMKKKYYGTMLSNDEIDALGE
jgi:hypothetical protein